MTPQATQLIDDFLSPANTDKNYWEIEHIGKNTYTALQQLQQDHHTLKTALQHTTKALQHILKTLNQPMIGYSGLTENIAGAINDTTYLLHQLQQTQISDQ